MKRILSLILISFTLVACLKDIPEVDALNSNLFDRDYDGEQWFEIESVNSFVNSDGQFRIKLETYIRKERFGNLKPSRIEVHAEGDGLELTVVEFILQPNGDYRKDLELKYIEGLSTYCVTLGIFIEEENKAINLFSDCVPY